VEGLLCATGSVHATDAGDRWPTGEFGIAVAAVAQGEEIQSHKISVPNDKVGRIVGKAGATINEIRKDTGARIDVPSNTGTQTREITVTGTVAQIGSATTLISQKMAGM